MIEIYKEILNIFVKGGNAVLATIISAKGHTPRNAGAKIFIKNDGTTVGSIGGGGPEAIVCSEAKEVLKEGVPRIINFDLTKNAKVDVGMICGGKMDVYVEPIFSKPKLFIFGGGHIAIPLAKISKLSEFRVTVIDNRKEFANTTRFPEVDEVINVDFKKAFSLIKIDTQSYIVIITKCHREDKEVLEMAVKTPATYIGMIGSSKKKDLIFSKLLKKGVKRNKLTDVHSPIGVEINSKTPAEIAISIIAEMIKIRNT